jgi:hypothetical protein
MLSNSQKQNRQVAKNAKFLSKKPRIHGNFVNLLVNSLAPPARAGVVSWQLETSKTQKAYIHN